MLNQPVSVYINWAAYDELSDNVQLTEALAMRQLDELLRLRQHGCRFDYYLMDAFWYAPEGGYRQWRKPHWPDGPDRWLNKCLENGVKPGLWVATNCCAAFAGLTPHPAWEDSLVGWRGGCCMFAGGFLQHFMESLDLWYQRGVRAFKFDFANLGAATPAIERTMLPSEIRQANSLALRAALKSFRVSHPEVLLLAYNGFDEGSGMANTSLPTKKVIGTAWLEAFDAMYCGDPRPADVPAFNFWRSKDVYSDHMVRLFHANGFPLSRIDNSGFMIGKTGTCYWRGAAAWKGMLLLSLARGGWANTYYGNLELLDSDDAGWFARAQQLFLPLQQFGQLTALGAEPGSGQPYGFIAADRSGGLITLVNPGQCLADISLPATAGSCRLLFRDAGMEPRLAAGQITLGPEQMAVIGYGSYAQGANDLGVQEDVVIPRSITPLAATVEQESSHAMVMKLQPPDHGRLRVIFRQTEPNGTARRLSGGAAPKGVPMAQMLQISATQAGKPVPVDVRYDKLVWSGLSWAVGQIDSADTRPSTELIIRFITREPSSVQLSGECLHVLD